MVSEFGRMQDVQRRFGLRRGIVYGLIRAGAIRSVSLRKAGRSTGVRLVYMPSVAEFLTREMRNQELAGLRSISHADPTYSHESARATHTRVERGGKAQSRDKCRRATSTMKIKIHPKSHRLVPEGMYAATVSSVRPKGDTKCVIEFAIEMSGATYVVHREYTATLSCGSDLLHDAKVLLGKDIECTATSAELELESLVGQKCTVVTVHKNGVGGRTIAAVTAVLPVIASAQTK